MDYTLLRLVLFSSSNENENCLAKFSRNQKLSKAYILQGGRFLFHPWIAAISINTWLIP